MRVDVNISIMPVGSTEFGTRAELKNLNSLKAIGRAIEYEINRQAEILDNGGTVIQETRRYNDNHGDTKALRSKEDAHDYQMCIRDRYTLCTLCRFKRNFFRINQ